jgi:hypothetical protein
MPPKLNKADKSQPWEGVNPNEGVRTRRRHEMLGSAPFPSQSYSPEDVSAARNQQEQLGEGDSTLLTHADPEKDTETAKDVGTTGPANESPLSINWDWEQELDKHAVTTSDQKISTLSTPVPPPQVSISTAAAGNDLQEETNTTGIDQEMNSFGEPDQNLSFIPDPPKQMTMRSSRQQNLDNDPVLNSDLQAQIAATPTETGLHMHNLNSNYPGNYVLFNYLLDVDLPDNSLDTDFQGQLPIESNSPTSDMQQDAGSEIGSNITTNSVQETLDRLKAENEDLKAENDYFRLMSAIAGKGCESAS